MNHKNPVLAVALLTGLFAGCTTVVTAPDIMINPPSAKGETWTLGGRLIAGAPAVIYINGVQAVFVTELMAPSTANGTYENHAIQAVCTGFADSQRFSCQINVDGTQAATLFF